MTIRRLLLVLAGTILLFTACEVENSPVLPPTAQPPTYSTCTITFDGVVIEQGYLSTNSSSGTIDTTGSGTSLDTLRSVAVTVHDLTADGYILRGSVTVSGFNAGMPWDSSRSVRAEFGAQSGYLLSLHFAHHHGESMTSPGGLTSSYSYDASARGEGYVAESGTEGEFIWEGKEAAEAFFHSFTSTENSTVQTSHYKAWTTGTRYLPNCRIVVRFE